MKIGSDRGGDCPDLFPQPDPPYLPKIVRQPIHRSERDSPLLRGLRGNAAVGPVLVQASTRAVLRARGWALPVAAGPPECHEAGCSRFSGGGLPGGAKPAADTQPLRARWTSLDSARNHVDDLVGMDEPLWTSGVPLARAAREASPWRIGRAPLMRRARPFRLRQAARDFGARRVPTFEAGSSAKVRVRASRSSRRAFS
jgi:hypothetical protein